MRSLYRSVALVVFAVAVAFAWHAYRMADAWHVGFPRHLGDLLPLYADTRPVDLADTDRLHAIRVAIAAAFVAVVGTAYCVASRRSTIACLIVALAGVLATNVGVGFLRHDHDGFVEPFTRGGLEYHPVVPLVRDDPVTFIADYPRLARQRRLGQHPGTHPPGGVLFLWLGEKLFAPAVDPPRPPATTPRLALIRRILAMRADRRDDPTLDGAVWLAVDFTTLGVLPAFWLATSMDGVFLTFCVAALALGVAAVRRRSWVWPILAGIALWLATFMTFAAVAIPVMLVCLTITDAFRRRRRANVARGFDVVIAAPSHVHADKVGHVLIFRRWRETLSAVARCAAVGVVFVLCQLAAQRWLRYDFRATADAAMRVDLSGVGVTGYESRTLWACLAFGNAFAFALGSGVATIALVAIGLLGGVRRWRPIERFGVAFALTIAALATSTLFTLETERVWLFLTPAALIVATMAFRGRVVWALSLFGLLGQTIWTEVYFRTWW